MKIVTTRSQWNKPDHIIKMIAVYHWDGEDVFENILNKKLEEMNDRKIIDIQCYPEIGDCKECAYIFYTEPL